MRNNQAKGWGQKWILTGVATWAVAVGCAHKPTESMAPRSIGSEPASAVSVAADESDPFQWLEDIEGEKALNWVRARNATALKRFNEDKRYAGIETDLKTIALAKDRIPAISFQAGKIWNFWQDSEHKRGIWRRTSLAEYRKPAPIWEIILDLDALAESEKENWVYKSVSCLPPEFARCLVTLSRGGKDAAVVREFDVESKSFVAGGFLVPEAKSNVAWKDKDTLWVGTDFGPGSLTTSGYARIVKLWKRGTPLSDARSVFEGKVEDSWTVGYTDFRPEGNIDVISRAPSFFEADVYLANESLKLTRVPLPLDAEFKGRFDGRLFFLLRKDLKSGLKIFARGSLVSLPLTGFDVAKPSLVLAPPKNGAISGLSATKSHLYVSALEDVESRLYEITFGARGWTKKRVPLPEKGSIEIDSAESYSDEVVLGFESFLVPTSQMLMTPPLATEGSFQVETLKVLPKRFDERGLVVEQFRAKSKDGTRVPYFVIHRQNMNLDGSNPTLLYAYGGFEISMTPSYLSNAGKVWLEKGGVYVLANIRGGGEYGPAWHETVLKENRHKVFEDFFSVSEDLIKRKITSSRRLGIMGGSNGGLLMGVSLTQRPELYRAVVSQVPLMDMLRYTKLLAGASWIGEYGDPDDEKNPQIRAALRSYSPYHNVRAEKTFPLAFINTTTKDDRVHPGHARKMVARLEAAGKSVLYFEHIQGGHGGGTNPEEHAERRARDWVYLFQMLVD